MAKKKKDTGLGGADALFEEIKKSEKPDPPKQKKEKPTTPPKFRRKTYLMSDELIERIEAIAEAEHVGINELHRYLVDLALTQIEDGTHTLETQSTQQRTLGA